MKKTEIIDMNAFFKYLYLTLALAIAALSYNLFMRSFGIVTGGAGGFGMVMEHITGIDSSVIVFILCAVCAVFGFIFLGFEDSIAALYIAIVFPLFIKMFDFLVSYFSFSRENLLLAVIFGGILNGISNGMLYQTGLNTGGFGVISKIIYKYSHRSVTSVNFIINSIIVVVGGFIFGFTNAIYAVIMNYIITYVSEKIFIGISKSKAFYIISSKDDQIFDFIVNEMKHDVTIFNVVGEYMGDKRKMIMSVIPTREYFMLKSAIKEIDDDAFVFVADSYEVLKEDVLINS